MKWSKIKFSFSPRRKIKDAPKPIARSEYANLLFEEGAGWNDKEKTN